MLFIYSLMHNHNIEIELQGKASLVTPGPKISLQQDYYLDLTKCMYSLVITNCMYRFTLWRQNLTISPTYNIYLLRRISFLFLPCNVVDIMAFLKSIFVDLSKASPVGFLIDRGNLTTVPFWRSICRTRPWELSVTAIKFDVSTSISKRPKFEDQINIVLLFTILYKFTYKNLMNQV